MHRPPVVIKTYFSVNWAKLPGHPEDTDENFFFSYILLQMKAQGWWVLMQQGRRLAVPTKNTQSDVQQIMCW